MTGFSDLLELECERKEYRMTLGMLTGKLEEQEEWNWPLLNGKVCRKSSFGSLENLSKNPIHMKISKGSWIY